MIRGLIFDFDGMILDTEIVEYQVWQEVYREYNQILPLERWSVCIGTSSTTFDPIAYLEELLGYSLNKDAIQPRRRQRYKELLENLEALPGVEGYLRDATVAGLKLGIASSSSRAWVVGHLSRLNLIDYFQCIRTRDDVTQVKPAPELYLAALDALELEPNEAVVFEDSYNGLLAAKAAGIQCVVVPNEVTQHMDFTRADIKLASLDEMPLRELLDHLNNSKK